MNILKSFVIVYICLFSNCVWGAALRETWQLQKSVDYYGRAPTYSELSFDAISIEGDLVRLGKGCAVRFNPEDYYFSDVFQPLTKEGVTEQQLNRFLMKNLGISLQGVKKVHALGPAPENCARPVMEFFVIGERIIVPVGVTFFSFAKPSKVRGSEGAHAAPSIVQNYKLSKLPMDFDRYLSHCRPKIVGRKGRPTTTDKCAPDFYPYVADSKSNDPLMRLVGNHDYEKNGLESASGFSPPFEQNVPATFLVFPPRKNIVLVRVDDFEVVRNEERDVMTGVYLSIVDGRVVDQIWGCHIDSAYNCVIEGKVQAKILPNGKFQELPLNR